MARRRRAIRPTKPMPNRDKVAGSGVATDVAEKLTLSRSAPILPGVLLVKTRAAVVGAPTIMVSFTMPLLTSELARLKVWVNKEPSVTVVDVIRPRCEPMRSKLSLYVPGARDITAELICPAAPVLPSISRQFPDVGATQRPPKSAPPTMSTAPPVTVKNDPIFVAFKAGVTALKFSLMPSALHAAGAIRSKAIAEMRRI